MQEGACRQGHTVPHQPAKEGQGSPTTRGERGGVASMGVGVGAAGVVGMVMGVVWTTGRCAVCLNASLKIAPSQFLWHTWWWHTTYGGEGGGRRRGGRESVGRWEVLGH